jgi:hypothetical protein
MGQLIVCNISAWTAAARVQAKTCSWGMAPRTELARVFFYMSRRLLHEPPALI